MPQAPRSSEQTSAWLPPAFDQCGPCNASWPSNAPLQLARAAFSDSVASLGQDLPGKQSRHPVAPLALPSRHQSGQELRKTARPYELDGRVRLQHIALPHLSAASTMACKLSRPG
jgi:hypothetical protein